MPPVTARPVDHIGLALLTLHPEASRDFEGTLAQVAAIGYRELDMYIYESTLDASKTRAILDKTGLACTSARVRTPALYRGWERFLDAAVALGARYITLADLPAPERASLQDWRELIALFNRCGQVAARRGLAFCYHNHEGEFTPIDGVVPYDMMIAQTEPFLVKLQMDVYSMKRAGRDPIVEMRRLSSRVATLHLKDMDATPARGITTVGKGTIDFTAIMHTAMETGVTHWYVEEDSPKTPGIEAVRSAYTYLNRLDV